MKNREKREKVKSIGSKISLMVMVMIMLTASIIGGFSYYKYRSEVILLKTSEVIAIASAVSSAVDGDQFKSLADSNSETKYYSKLKEALSKAKIQTGVKYLYTVIDKPEEQGLLYIAEGATPQDNPDDIFTFKYPQTYAESFSGTKDINTFTSAYKSGTVYEGGIYDSGEFGMLLTGYAPIFDSSGNTVGMVGADLNADDVVAEANKFLYIIVTIILLAGILLFFVSRQFIKKNVSKPITSLSQIADRLAIGDMEVSVKAQTTDEIGQLMKSFGKMIGNIQSQADVGRKIAAGDLTIDIVLQSDKDTLGQAMKSVIETLRRLISEAGMLSVAAVEGRLDTRGNAAAFSGGYKDIVDGVNKTLDAVIGPLNVAAEYVDRISKGDMPPKISDSYNGDFNEIKNNLNTCIDAVNALVEDAVLLSVAAVEGRLDTRADAGKHAGDFARIVDGVNKTLDAVIGPLNVAAEYVDRISKGDMPPKISDSYNGDFNEIKNNLNTCIDAVNALVEDAGMLSVAAVEGRLDTRADAGKHAGDFGKIVDGVNKTLDAVIGPLSVAARYIDMIGKGEI
ncbi:MAG: HAMP domain-containing protein, partial [Eubacteriales bacterium]